jgi:hypothetical protein
MGRKKLDTIEDVDVLEVVDVIGTVNKEVLKSFRSLQSDKTNFYTSAVKFYLTSINDKAMIVYDNPQEIDFEGTFKITRNKLVPVTCYNLKSSPEKAINLAQFNLLGDFGSNLADLQKYCYDKPLRINLINIITALIQLVSVYGSFKLYENKNRAEVMFVFVDKAHKTYLLSKMI